MNMFQADISAQQISRLIDEEKPKLLNFISRKIKDTSYSEDIYQEALERTVKRSRQGFQPADPVSYIYKVVINVINDYYSQRSQETLELDSLCGDDEPPCQKPLPDHQAEAKQRLDMFLSCLKTLPAETSNILIMRKVHGLSNAEIGRRIGKSPKSVEKRINRAIRSIQEQIERGVPTASKNKWF